MPPRLRGEQSLSDRRLAANRANALKSTGPRTAAGKQRSRLNALKHGVCSDTPVLPSECAATFATFRHELECDLRPRNPIQLTLFQRIVNLTWKLRRIQEAENHLFEIEAAKVPATDDGAPPDPCRILAHRFSDDPHNAFILLNRYEQGMHRELRQLITRFFYVQKQVPTTPYSDEDLLPNEPTNPPAPSPQPPAAPELADCAPSPAPCSLRNEPVAAPPAIAAAAIIRPTTASPPPSQCPPLPARPAPLVHSTRTMTIRAKEAMMSSLISLATCLVGLAVSFVAAGAEPDWATLERQFREMPMEARRFVQPLFWLHGDDTKEQLELEIQKLADAHCGGFTAESRPHTDFLGPGWYRDLDICLQHAKKLGLKMRIFDEKWWPSQTIGGTVPERYAAKKLAAEAFDVEGPARFAKDGFGTNLVAAVAGKVTEAGIDGASLIDLGPMIKDGALAWDAPAGKWKVMKFTWAISPRGGQGKDLTVDGASQDCVDWYIQTVYQPHYDRFKDDFGKTIVGYFYDEPEVHGDWGTEAFKMLAERKIDWKKPLVAWKFQLAGEEQIAARYQYQDAFFETWGRTMYGGLQRWCEAHGVQSIGHFIEHGGFYLKWGGWAPGNMFQLQKYSAMGGIDNVFNQFRIGTRIGRDAPVFQTPKLGSSISHVYGKRDQVAFCEIFGADGQDLAYSNMKWQADQHHVRGINLLIPHSFNPRAPFDTDCPPYFYNGGYEPRYPLFRTWADYTGRLSVLLTGGKHVCPVATIVCGNSVYAGKALTPEDITDALDDIQLDSDWMPYDALADASIEGRQLKLFDERYQILIAPPAEVVPYEALVKIKAFYDAGGIVIGYGILPAKSATLGKSAKEIVELREAIWGAGEITPATKLCRTSDAGGRSYFLSNKPLQSDLQQVLADAGVKPALQVLEGKTDNWLHVLHRVKSGRDVFLICNQNSDTQPRKFKFRATASGEPEIWDAMGNEIVSIPFTRIDAGAVEFELTMQPCESALLVFQPQKIQRPARIEANTKPAREAIALVRQLPTTQPAIAAPPGEDAAATALRGASWIWYPEGDPIKAAPAGTRYFRREVAIPAEAKIRSAKCWITADNSFILYVNGKQVGRGKEWRQVRQFDIPPQLLGTKTVLAIAATNDPADGLNPAGVIGIIRIEQEQGEPITFSSNKAWKTSRSEQPGWNQIGFDDASWTAAREIARFGGGPWNIGRRQLTLSPIAADPFIGTCMIPADLDLKQYRVYLEMQDLPDTSAAVTVNGQPAGGVIGRPCRVNIGTLLKSGENRIEIAPLPPAAARLVFYRD